MKSKLLSAFCTVALLAACTPTTPNQGAAKPLVIGAHLYPGYGPFFVAEEKGFFGEEGVNAHVELMSDIPSAISALANDSIQIMGSSADLTPIVANGGLDVSNIVVADLGYGADGLLVKNDVQSVSDLKGKTIHVSLASPSHFFLRYVTEKEGLKKTDFTMADMPPDQVGAAFAAGQVDYGMSWEPWLSQSSERKDGKVLFSSKDYLGAITDTWIARRDVMESRKEDIQKVLRAWFRALDFMKQNPAEANEIIARHFGLSVADLEPQMATVQFLTYEQNLDRFKPQTSLNVADVTRQAIAIYKEDGVINTDLNAERIAGGDILQSLYEQK